MKKFLLLSVVMSFAVIASAQGLKGLTVGGGVSIDPFAYSPSGDYEPKVTDGYHLEVAYAISFTKVSALGIGLRWTQTFNYREEGFEGAKARIDYTRGYIGIPIKYVAHFGGFFFNVGPTLNFFVLGEQKVKVDGKSAKESFIDNDINRFDTALGLELGYDWTHIHLAAGYDCGLVKLIKSSANAPTNCRRHEIRVTVGYRF